MIFLLLFLSFSAMAETYVCPPEIKSEQKILSVPNGWKTEEERLNARQSLSQISFYNGPVDEGASLAPSEENGKSVWVFDKTEKKKNYLACMYRMTFMVLVKELKNVSRCEVEYLKESAIPKSIVCKSE
jgi:hypothetical protein